jgi:4a-hydroxytetrahydrobiopterin dehydratase
MGKNFVFKNHLKKKNLKTDRGKVMVEKIALTEDELEERLKEMAPEWKTGKNEKEVPYIQRVHHASKFMEGIEFVRKVAEAAEENNHHPDIIINYKRISIRYWTHTVSGVTLADVQMAQKINPLF